MFLYINKKYYILIQNDNYKLLNHAPIRIFSENFGDFRDISFVLLIVHQNV